MLDLGLSLILLSSLPHCFAVPDISAVARRETGTPFSSFPLRSWIRAKQIQRKFSPLCFEGNASLSSNNEIRKHGRLISTGPLRM